MKTLSKSDFKLASDCPQKLNYKKQNYPSNDVDNEFLKMLAEGGHLVGKIAKLYCPSGIEIKGNTENALKVTRDLLKKDEVILFEPAFRSGQKLVRVDILKKKSNHFELIEVKSKAFDSNSEEFTKRNNNGELKNKDYIYDAIYQTIVLQELYPQAKIDTFLMMPDKAIEMAVEGFPQYFNIKIKEPKKEGGYPSIEVRFDKSKKAKNALNKVIDSKLLGLLNLNSEVNDFKEIVLKEANTFINYLNQDFENYTPILSKKCKSCEYRVPENVKPNGFQNCWGNNAFNSSHNIFDLYFGGALGNNNLLNEKIKEGKYSLWDLKIEDLVDSKGAVGKRNERQIIQYGHTKSNKEFPNTYEEVEQFKNNFGKEFTYPLFFIDFETMTSAIPFHQGLRPYQMFPFQFSVHKLESNGELTHFEYINTEEGYPGFRFASKLMEVVGEEGTPLMWSTHENTTLKGVLKQMEIQNFENNYLKEWLIKITKENGKREGRFVDMNEFTLKNYFHPDMKGQTSIKKVLPAIWNNNSYLHDLKHFKNWVIKDKDGNILDPYEKLRVDKLKEFWGFKANINIEEQENDYSVKDGGAAMKAYQEMIFCKDKDRQDFLKKQLLKYCKLDTLAMVIIFEHWKKIATTP